MSPESLLGRSCERDHALLMGDCRERAEQQAFDPTKHGGVRGDSQREAQDSENRETRAAPQHAQRITNVLQQSFEEVRAAGLASFFFDGLEAAELREGKAAGFVGRHACGDVVGNLLLDVEAHLCNRAAFPACLCETVG